MRYNTVRRNGDNGILIATSHSVDVYGNVLDSNFRGINLFVNCSVVGSADGGEIGEQIYMQDVSVHDNTITVGTRSGAWANALSDYACTATQLGPYLNGSQNLTFTRDAYIVPDLNTSWWVWGESAKNWSGWQGLNLDGAGSMKTP